MNKLFCYGDSNTYGWDPRDPMGGRYDKSWVDYLQELLGVPCVNAGQPGRRIPESPAELNVLRRMVTESGTDAMVILLGTNNRFLPPVTSPAETVRKMEKLLLFLRDSFPDLSLYLPGLPPMTLPGEDSGAWVSEVNRLYAALAEKYALPYFDPLPLELPLCFDGIHLTEDAHKLLGTALYSFLRKE